MSDLDGRVRRVVVNRNWILKFLTKGRCPPVVEGLPEGCQVVHFEHDLYKDEFTLFVYHPDFPVVEDGFVVPEIHIVYEAECQNSAA